MHRGRAFVDFWIDFVVGDDWRIALVVVVSVAATWAGVAWGINPWWLLPICVAVALPWSIWRASRAARRAR